MRAFFALLILTIFTGCGSKPSTPTMTKNQAITKTQKREVQLEGKRFLVVGTYLNDIKHPALAKDDYEHFIISLYEGGDNPFQEPIKAALLNDLPAYWEQLESDNPLLGMIPLYNAWGIYYHVWAPQVYPDTLSLKIEIDPLRQVDLVFQKDPR